MDPAALKYSTTHEWVAIDGQIATVGISSFAVEQLTDLTNIDLDKATVGATLSVGDEFGEVESVKSVSDLYAPVSGEVVEVNQAVIDNFNLLSEDPVGAGWLIKVKLANPDPELAELLDHDDYQKKIAEEAH